MNDKPIQRCGCPEAGLTEPPTEDPLYGKLWHCTKCGRAFNQAHVMGVPIPAMTYIPQRNRQPGR